MADEAVPVAAPTPAPSTAAVAAAPVAPAPSTAPAAPTPAVVETPVVAPVVEAAPAPVPTVLGAPPEKPIIEPPAEAAPAPAEPVIPEGQSADPAPPPVYEPFALPEGVTVNAERIGEFTGLLGEFEALTKADHAAVQAFGQKLIDRHVAEVQTAVNRLQTLYREQYEAQKTTWREQFMADPELGGNRSQTTIDAALSFLSTHGGSEEQQAEFRTLMDTSGLGNHPAMIRLLARAGMAMSEGRPLAAVMPMKPVTSKLDKMYGKSK